MSAQHLQIVKTILSRFPDTFLAFGSRVKGTYQIFSDLDLCYKKNISDVDIALLQELFEESDLPFKVDMVFWDRCTEEFQKAIENDLIPVEELWR